MSQVGEYSWKKWNDGWAVREWDGDAEPGDTVEVVTRAGKRQEVKLGELLSVDRKAKIFAAENGKSGNGNGEVKVDRPGVFETADGVFVVKGNAAHQMRTKAEAATDPEKKAAFERSLAAMEQEPRMYAKRLIVLRPAQGDRLTETGEAARFEFEYEKRAIFKLTEEDRMPKARAKELTLQYGRCLNCSRELVVKESLERGIGPVCAKAFR